jgi:hypothetical protein
MKTKIIILLVIIIFNASCSSDDDSSLSTNGSLTIGNQTFQLKSAYVFDENTENDDPSDISISFSNVENVFESNATNIVYVYFDVNEVTLQTTTYTAISDYTILTEGLFTEEFGITGNVILNDSGLTNLQASETSFTIHSLSNNQINITFSFLKNDGTEITGSYNGNYTTL